MTLPTPTHLQELLDQLTDSWIAGNGSGFGACFTDDAHFVAFDGTVLEGPAAIARYHQAAFDRYLRGTRLLLTVEGTCAIGECVRLGFISGSIESESGGAVMLTGESTATMFVVLRDGRPLAAAFQNTRRRPITDEKSASVWKEFDRSWAQREVTFAR